MTLAVGDPAPPFTVETTHGVLTLQELLTQGPLVLVFYVEDGTPACTAQLCAFRDEAGALAALGAQLLAVSVDNVKTHRAFAERERLSFPLASDADGSLARAYRVLDDDGRRSRRAVFVIGTDGVVHEALVPYQPGVAEQFLAVFGALGAEL
jgi:peroxiredoxin Q/BCP